MAAAARELRRAQAVNPLKDAHAALDPAVLAACGFSAKEDSLAQLLALNHHVAATIEKSEPATTLRTPRS